MESSRNAEACPRLELRLGPPGEEDWTSKDKMNHKERNNSVLSFGHFSTSWSSQDSQNQAEGSSSSSSFLQFASTTHNLQVMAKESSQPCSNKAAGESVEKKKAFSTSCAANTAVPSSSSQKRTAAAPVVGWPPIRSFRKNVACSSSSKQASESQNANTTKPVSEKPLETNNGKGMFVKINMDGVPIGRKVDLKAYDSYDKLSLAVDELFRGLLAAQKDSCAGGNKNNQEEEKAITGLLDGSGEYTLVYEDNEGDRMLVGDVPWHMFVSTVKRLRVLKSSEVSAMSFGSTKQGKMSLHSVPR